ncbi:uncharacterized protein K452DRAFT_296554 [Aplosporella prunicola CBS 121167]|uniref:AB hydrolase-1 domain-containing protein n=1 Tax=Aplosporella prunicola CBS 121167 TaxID=1176127 RepID=A0A6A6BHC8_9PEZI|nr:uncharacterized protein K452DRAFT_296554 [Aplosporella prunicola CBS 121167]KAF2143540.1 hypothetical protein K452DRAFT_296554 [Aplosporella prunicola CBS 121167]
MQFLTLILYFIASVHAVTVPPSKWNYTYPWPVQYYNLTSQEQTLSMAYMDVRPNSTSSTSSGNDSTIVLLHGKNFCGATWERTARLLAAHGYRVIIPDQIGFCKSSKPRAYQFSLQQLARNTRDLLQRLGITRATMLGHSMGGMLAARFALAYPDLTARLVLTNPLGLEDWVALGVPWQSISAGYATELASNFSSIKAYQQSTYYAGTWDGAYDEWVAMLVSVYELAGEGDTFAYDMALTTDMVLTQPVVYELGALKMATLLLIGQEDNTAIGKAWAPEEVKPLLGHYDVLGKQTADRIPGATLVEFEGLGHAPQIQDPEAYHAALLEWLGK